VSGIIASTDMSMGATLGAGSNILCKEVFCSMVNVVFGECRNEEV